MFSRGLLAPHLQAQGPRKDERGTGWRSFIKGKCPLYLQLSQNLIFSSNYKIRYLASSKLSKPDNFPPEWYEVDVAAILTIIFVFFIGATLEVRK